MVLKEAQAQVDSEGLRGALKEAEDAKQATEQRLVELREQREELLAQNARDAGAVRRGIRSQAQGAGEAAVPATGDAGDQPPRRMWPPNSTTGCSRRWRGT